MSKNFELLHEIGGNDGLFRTPGQTANDVLRGDGKTNREIDREARERILQNATLPNVLEIPESNERRCEQGGVVSSPGDTVDMEIRTPEKAATPSVAKAIYSGPSKSTESQKSSKNVVLAEGFSTAARRPAMPGAIPTKERELREKAAQKKSGEDSSPFRWMRSVKSRVERWNRKLEVPNNLRVSEMESIAREEEVKLVERVFPEKDEQSARVALFAGLEGGCGAAVICARSAEILAARGDGPVCIVDANFQLPSLHRYFGVENGRGLAEATMEAGPIQSFVQQIPEPDLWLLPAGKALAGNGFSKIADGLRVRIKELRAAFPYVIIHAGSLRLETSAMLMSRWTDGVVLVVEANSTRRDSAKRAKENLEAANVSILGVVLTNRTFPIPEAIYRRL